MQSRILWSVLAVAVSSSAFGVDAQFSLHPVSSVPAGDRLVVVYAGMPITVRLAHVDAASSAKLQAEAKNTIEKLVKGKLVRAAYCREAGLDENGLPQVFVSVGMKVVNVELVKRGYAKYAPGARPSKYYATKMKAADKTAQASKAGLWSMPQAVAAAEPSKPAAAAARVTAASLAPAEIDGSVYSELNSSQFHLPTCRWAKQMSPQRRIRYKSIKSAKRAGKRPCWICLAEEAKTAVFGAGPASSKVRVLKGKGPLVACGGVLHACNCEVIITKGGACTSVATWKQAQRAGLKPCTRCLRLAGGEVPLPGKGECIGRAPPHRRPCRRAPADKSGLCLHCQGKE